MSFVSDEMTTLGQILAGQDVGPLALTPAETARLLTVTGAIARAALELLTEEGREREDVVEAVLDRAYANDNLLVDLRLLVWPDQD